MGGVTVRLAGSMAVLRRGQPEDRIGLGSRKARRLLALLAVRRGHLVATSQIVEVLWAEQPPRRPVRDVATLVSRLRALLGPDVVLGGRDAYRLGSPPAVTVDLDDAARMLTECTQLIDSAPARAALAGDRALSLLGAGTALPDEPDSEWAQDARTEHEALRRAARHVTAEAALRAADPLTARRIAEASVRADHLDETAHRLLMAAHQAAGDPNRALAVYRDLREALTDQLGVDPAPQTLLVHEAVLTERSAMTHVVDGIRDARLTAVPVCPEMRELIGRAGELAQLAGAWGLACQGEPALWLVAGEGGIGKTRLAEELTAVAEPGGGLVLHARCYSSERSLFLQPLVEAAAAPLGALPAGRLRELAGPRAGALAALLPDLAAMLGPVDAARASPEVELRRIHEAVTAVLRGLATQQPVLLLLDDLHNAGLATVELLHYLARHSGKARLLVLATIRVEEGEATLDALADVSTRLELGPLPAAAVARLAADAGRAELAETILRRTRGHTMFVVETLRGLAAGEDGAPESLHAVVLARLRRLGAPIEELLRAGAVLGSTVDPAIIARMLDLAPHTAALRCEQAAAARLLTVTGRAYEFANDLVQEVLYASTPVPTRIAHHLRAADLLAAPEAVAAHATAGQDWPRAARAFLAAGERAVNGFATADAEALFGRALHSGERAADAELIARAYLGRGRTREVLGSFRAALGDHRAAAATARQAGDRRLEMLALRELGGHAAVAVGVSMEECSNRIRQGLRIAESLGDRAEEAGLLGWLTVLATNQLRFADAFELGRRAVLAGRAAGSDRALAVGLDGLKNAYAYLGEIAATRDTVEQLEPLARRVGDPNLLVWTLFEAALPDVGCADWTRAEQRIEAAIGLARRNGNPMIEPWSRAHLGWLARQQGRLDEAVDQGERAVALAADRSHPWLRPLTAAMLGHTLVESGASADAVAVLTAGRAHAEGGAEAYLLRCLAPLAEASGDPATLGEADALLSAVSAPPGSAWLLGADVYLAVARAWLDHGEPARARAVLGPLLAAAQRQRWLPVLAAAGLVDGQSAAALGDTAAAGAALSTAAELAERHGMPLLARAARAGLASRIPHTAPDVTHQ